MNQNQGIVEAVCLREPKDFDTQWGEKTKAEFTLGNGDTVPVWALRGKMPYLQRGTRVELIQGAKGYNFGRILAPAAASASAAPTSSTAIPGAARPLYQKPPVDTLREIGAYLNDATNLLASCFKKVNTHPDLQKLNDEDKRAFASSIYIGACRKFNL